MSMEVRLEQIERELKELKRREDKKNDSELSITSVRKPGEIVTSSFISKEIKTFDFETGKQEVVIEGPYFDESGKILREARLARCSQCKKLFSADSVISYEKKTICVNCSWENFPGFDKVIYKIMLCCHYGITAPNTIEHLTGVAKQEVEKRIRDGRYIIFVKGIFFKSTRVSEFGERAFAVFSQVFREDPDVIALRDRIIKAISPRY